MAKFEVLVTRIDSIDPIEGSDFIELATVGGYKSVVQKNLHVAGGLAVYVPEGSLIPEPLLTIMNLNGKLAGSNKNRVKAVRLRGQLSQGLLIPVDSVDGQPFISAWYDHDDPVGVMQLVKEGDDVAAALGITKWEQPIPINLAGEVYSAGQRLTVEYDIENIKKYNNVLEPGESVHITEKIHGTYTGVAILPLHEYKDDDIIVNGEHFVVFSKGLGADGLCFKGNQRNIENNLYVRTLMAQGVFDKLAKLKYEVLTGTEFGNTDVPLLLCGETYGDVQDLTYGGGAKFRAFDLAVGYRGSRAWCSRSLTQQYVTQVGIDYVPVLYVGPFSDQVLEQYTNGKETVSGKQLHIREGVVVTTEPERNVADLGRVILKSVSAAYLLRKSSNATEYQ